MALAPLLPVLPSDLPTPKARRLLLPLHTYRPLTHCCCTRLRPPPRAERVLPSIIQETLKSVIAQYNASQLLTMREVRAVGVRWACWDVQCALCTLLLRPNSALFGAVRAQHICLVAPPPTNPALPCPAAPLSCLCQVVSRDIRRILTQRARYFNIVLDDVSITQLTFR